MNHYFDNFPYFFWGIMLTYTYVGYLRRTRYFNFTVGHPPFTVNRPSYHPFTVNRHVNRTSHG